MELHLLSFNYEHHGWWWLDVLNVATPLYCGSLLGVEHSDGTWKFDVLWLQQWWLNRRESEA